MNTIFNFSTLDFSDNEEITNILIEGKNTRIERIISSGQITPADFWYDQNQHEFVMVLQGEAKILFDDNQEKFFKQGDYLVIGKHVKHRVIYTSSNPKCIWLAIFYD
jgi:cupin 2 domain-containing protein